MGSIGTSTTHLSKCDDLTQNLKRGNDTIYGGEGFDILFGAQGNDLIFSADGATTVAREDIRGARMFGTIAAGANPSPRSLAAKFSTEPPRGAQLSL